MKTVLKIVIGILVLIIIYAIFSIGIQNILMKWELDHYTKT
jgi:uncharacterized protein YxeA